MKETKYKDEQGKKHVAITLNNSHGLNNAITQDPPDIELIDWESVKIELHNGLIDKGLFTLKDIENKNGALSGVVLSSLKREVIKLYKTESTEVL